MGDLPQVERSDPVPQKKKPKANLWTKRLEAASRSRAQAQAKRDSKAPTKPTAPRTEPAAPRTETAAPRTEPAAPRLYVLQHGLGDIQRNHVRLAVAF